MKNVTHTRQSTQNLFLNVNKSDLNLFVLVVRQSQSATKSRSKVLQCLAADAERKSEPFESVLFRSSRHSYANGSIEHSAKVLFSPFTFSPPKQLVFCLFSVGSASSRSASFRRLSLALLAELFGFIETRQQLRAKQRKAKGADRSTNASPTASGSSSDLLETHVGLTFGRPLLELASFVANSLTRLNRTEQIRTTFFVLEKIATSSAPVDTATTLQNHLLAPHCRPTSLRLRSQTIPFLKLRGT
jgi:hypothetical protein